MELQHTSLPSGQKTLLLSVQTSQHGIAMYIKVKEGQSVRTEEFGSDDLILDLDAGGDLLGIEILAFRPETPGRIREIAIQFDIPELVSRFHPENLPQVFV